jgi:hypothetical protein
VAVQQDLPPCIVCFQPLPWLWPSQPITAVLGGARGRDVTSLHRRFHLCHSKGQDLSVHWLTDDVIPSS